MQTRSGLGCDPGGTGSDGERPGDVTPRLGVVVVTYASSDLLERHLTVLSRQLHDAVVVVVDNFSTHQECQRLDELARSNSWELVSLPDNRGFGPAVDAGVAATQRRGCTEVLLLNPDAIATPGAVAALWQHCRRFPDSIVSPKILTSTGTVYSRGSGLQLWNGVVVRLGEGQREATGVLGPDGGNRSARVVQPWLTAACVAMPISVFEQVGGMGDGYFMYWEDVDLSIRAARAGIQLVVLDDVSVIHDEGGTQDTRFRGKSGLYYYYNCRNRLLFGSRHVEPRVLIRWILATPRASWKILMRGGRRQLIQSPQPTWQIVKGSVAGLWLATKALAGRSTTGGEHAVGAAMAHSRGDR